MAIAFTTVFVLSLITFGAIKATFGLRVSDEDEEAGLDISEHGMYGYPEQFIPAAELIGYRPAGSVPRAGAGSNVTGPGNTSPTGWYL